MLLLPFHMHHRNGLNFKSLTNASPIPLHNLNPQYTIRLFTNLYDYTAGIAELNCLEIRENIEKSTNALAVEAFP